MDGMGLGCFPCHYTILILLSTFINQQSTRSDSIKMQYYVWDKWIHVISWLNIVWQTRYIVYNVQSTRCLLGHLKWHNVTILSTYAYLDWSASWMYPVNIINHPALILKPFGDRFIIIYSICCIYDLKKLAVIARCLHNHEFQLNHIQVYPRMSS